MKLLYVIGVTFLMISSSWAWPGQDCRECLRMYHRCLTWCEWSSVERGCARECLDIFRDCREGCDCCCDVVPGS